MKRLGIGLAAVCVLALCVVGIVWLGRAQQQAEFLAAGPANLAREEAAARQEGIPLTASELQKPLPPPGQNAAPLYTKLTKLLHDKPLNLPPYAEGMDAFHTYTPEQIAVVRRTLAKRQDVMTLVHQATDKPQCVFVRDWGKGLKLEFPEYQRMHKAARLLKIESYLLARDGHYREAITNQARGFRVAAHAASDPILLAYVVGNSNELITLTGMQSILALAGTDSAVSRQVQQSVRLHFVPLSVRTVLVTEPAVMDPVFQQLHQGQHQGIKWFDSSLGNLTSGKDIATDPQKLVSPVSDAEQKLVSDTIDAQQANYLLDMRRMIAATKEAKEKRLSVYASLLDDTAPSTKNGARIMSFILLPDGRKLDEDDLRLKTRRSVTLAAASLLAEKAKAGTYPGSLPQEFTDPFTDKPLVYRREGSGFVVYSAGPTGHFDGGKPGEKVPGQESAFRYPAVPVVAAN